MMKPIGRRSPWYPATQLAFALTATVGVGAVCAQMIELRSNTSLEGNMVLLRDIVHAPHALPEIWRDREIVKAPQPGEPIKMPLTVIAAALNRHEDMSRVVLRGEAEIELQRSGSMLAVEKLHEAVRAYASEQPQWLDTELHIQCEAEPMEIASSDSDPEIRALSMTPDDRPNHYQFAVEIALPDAPTRSATVSARIEPMQKVKIAAQAMARGHVLSFEDLEDIWMPPEAARPYITGDVAELMGMELNREVRARQPLASHFLVPPVNARRGDTVNVMAVRGGLQVALRATALATGRRGERIMCMNETSRRRFLVRLTDVREATVDF